MTAVVIFTIQIVVVCQFFIWPNLLWFIMTILLQGFTTICCMLPKCRKSASDNDETVDATSTRTTSFTYSVVDVGDFPRLTISQPESPAESVTCKSLSIPLPRDCAIVRRMRAETYAGFSGWNCLKSLQSKSHPATSPKPKLYYPVFLYLLLLLTGFKIFLDDLVRLAQLSKSNIVI